MSNRPANREELFNLRHASARNCVERIFGIVKNRWAVLQHAPQYDMGIQARIPAALAALHNFILKHDSDLELNIYADAWDPAPGYSTAYGQSSSHGNLSESLVSPEEKARADQRRDEISQAMWDSYQEFIQEHLTDGLE